MPSMKLKAFKRNLQKQSKLTMTPKKLMKLSQMRAKKRLPERYG
jgi:hypothetical protein